MTAGPPPTILVFGDSLAFHGPSAAETVTDDRLWPNVAASALGARADVVARLGWLTRDGWWAMTKDAYVYSVLLPRADAVVLALGTMDHLPASVPSYLREGIAYLRPGRLRRGVREAYLRVHPLGVRAWRGRLRMLPQRASDSYLTRSVRALRALFPGLPLIGIVPAPFAACSNYPLTTTHLPAVEAARAWGHREGVQLLDLHAVAAPHFERRSHNPDGLHWSWELHAEVGAELARLLARVWADLPGPGRGAAPGTWESGPSVRSRSWLPVPAAPGDRLSFRPTVAADVRGGYPS